MLSREDLFYRLNYLVQDAKFCFWPVLDEEGNDSGFKGYENTVDMDGWRIAWYGDNLAPLPKLEDIKALQKTDIDKHVETKAKEARDTEKAKDLTLVACYEIEKKSNPNLNFSAYLDDLQIKQKNLSSKNK